MKTYYIITGGCTYYVELPKDETLVEDIVEKEMKAVGLTTDCYNIAVSDNANTNLIGIDLTPFYKGIIKHTSVYK